MEDFVTFEIAKKLKEKGFPIKTELQGKLGLTEIERIEIYPTIHQVLKWLREEKGLHIEIRFDNRGFGACIDKYDIHTLEYISFNPLLDFGFHKSYEQAAIEGVNYCLENLI